MSICAECVEIEDGLRPVVRKGRTVLLCETCRNGRDLRGQPLPASVSQRSPSVVPTRRDGDTAAPDPGAAQVTCKRCGDLGHQAKRCTLPPLGRPVWIESVLASGPDRRPSRAQYEQLVAYVRVLEAARREAVREIQRRMEVEPSEAEDRGQQEMFA